MTPTPGFRSTAAVVLAAIVLAAAYAQSPAEVLPYGSIGLYVDEGRSSNTVSYPGAPAEFTMYVFCRPGEQGMIAAEFGIAYPANVIPAAVTENLLISISLGSLDAGISVAFLDCQNDWVWTHHQSLFLVNADETRIEIEKHRAADAYQFATCELGYPAEPALISSAVCCNAACPPDTVPPLLQEARCISLNGVDLVFSEALFETSAENPLHYEIAESSEPSVTLATGNVTLLADERSVRLYTTEPFLEGHMYVIRAHDIRDRWGNKILPGAERTFTALDRDPPRLLSASVSNVRSLTAVFNETVDPATAGNRDNYRLYYYIDPDSPERDIPCPCYPRAAVLASENSVLLSFDAPGLPIERTITLRVRNVSDLAGNVITTHNTATFVVHDVYPPTISFVTVTADTVLQVVFSEKVTDSTASAAGNYEVFEKADTLSTVPVTHVTLLGDAKTVNLRLGAHLDLGTPYLLRVHGIKDLAGNSMSPPGTVEFTAADFLPPVPLSATALTRYLIRVVFNKPLEEASAETALNYQVNETSDAIHTIPVTGAELEPSRDAVRLILGAALVYDLSYTVHIVGVKDLRGNAIVSASVTTVCPPDTLPPSFTGVTPKSGKLIELAFDEKLRKVPAEDESNYLLSETDTPSNVVEISSAALAEGGSRVQLSLSANLVPARGYTISVSNLADLDGNMISPGTSRAFVYTDTIPPRLLRARADESTVVLASFSEILDAATAENADNYRVFETGSESVISLIAGAALARDSSSVRLSLGGEPLMAGIAYSLRVIGVTDRASNPVPTGSIVPITMPDTTPPLIKTVEALMLRYVKVTFDEPVTPATAGVPANYLLVPLADPGGAAGPSAVDMPDDGTVGLWFIQKLVTGGTYTLRVSNVADLAGNEILAGSEKSFVCPSAATPGYIGLFVEESRRGCRINCTDEFTPFKMYVWCLAGSAGQIAAEFRVVYPENVIRSAVTVNPIVSVYLGDLESNLSAVFSECNPGWEWVAVQDCYLTSHDQTTIGVGSGPISATCAPGYPIETMEILSKISCNGSSVGTLLQDFSASYEKQCIEVTWRLSEKDDGVRFSISRAERGAARYCELSGEIVGTGLSFSYRDESVEPGKAYRYRVQYMDGSGIHILFESDPVAVPAIPLTLNQNWPNPFNPLTTISYYLPEAARVRLEIYDVAGRRIACLVNGNEERGNHNAVWNGAGESGRPAAPGIYLYRLTAGRETLSRKMVLVR